MPQKGGSSTLETRFRSKLVQLSKLVKSLAIQATLAFHEICPFSVILVLSYVLSAGPWGRHYKTLRIYHVQTPQ